MHAAYNVRLSLPAIITVLHVWGHQDKTKADFTSLPLSAHLNIVADDGTHQVYKTHPHSQQTSPLPSTQATLVLKRSRVTSKMTIHASLAYYRAIMADYFQHKFGRDNKTFSNIDWDSSEKEYYRLSPGRRLASFKLQNGLWPINKTLHQRKQAPSPLCSWCNLDPETHNHVLYCEQAQPTRLQQWLLVPSVLRTTLNTPAPIHDALKFGIRSWQEGEHEVLWPFPFPSSSNAIDDAIYLAFHQQTKIICPHALWGHLSSHWGLAMTTYMHHRYPNQAFKPTSWTCTVICSLREYVYSQWKECNSHIPGVNFKASQALQWQHVQEQITTEYHKKSSVPWDKQSSTFGIPHTNRLLQSTCLLNTWLLQ